MFSKPSILRCLVLGSLLVCAAFLAPTQAASLDRLPQFQVNYEGHWRNIRALAVSGDFKRAATAADDRRVVIWSVDDLKPLRVLRYPASGDSNMDRPLVVSLSPDGRFAAVGGSIGETWGDGGTVFLFDTDTGAIVARIAGLRPTIRYLAFSPDGKNLAIGDWEADGREVAIYSLEQSRIILRDRESRATLAGLSFDLAGRLLIAEENGAVRVLSPDFQKTLFRGVFPPPDANTKIVSVAFAPNGDEFVLSFARSGSVTLVAVAGNDYQEIKRRSFSCDSATLSWRPDSKMAYVGLCNDASSGNRVFAFSGYETDKTLSIGKVEPSAGLFRTVGPERFLAVLDDGALALVGAQGIERRTDAFRGLYIPYAFLSDDARALKLRLPSGSDNKTLTIGQARANSYSRRFEAKAPGFADKVFSLQARAVVAAETANEKFIYPVADRDGLALRILGEDFLRENASGDISEMVYRMARSGTVVQLNGWAPFASGNRLDPKHFYSGSKIWIDPVRDGFVVLGGRVMLLYDRNFREVRQFPVGYNGAALALSSEGRIAAVVYGDGVIDWFRMQDGKLLLSALIMEDGRWVAWTPEGFFDHSPGAEDLVGFSINDGPDKAPAFFSLGQMYDLFYRPDLIAKATQPSRDALFAAERTKVGDPASVLARGLPPEVRTTVQSMGSDGAAQIGLEITEKGGGFGRLTVQVNGATVLSEGKAADVPVGSGRTIRLQRSVKLTQSDNEIKVIAFNAVNQVESRPAVVMAQGPDRLTSQPGALAILAVGVNDYRAPAINKLVFAIADAEALTNKLKAAGAPVFKQVVVRTVFDQQASRDGIRRAISEMSRTLKPNDVFVLYLAGHGVNIAGKYYFIPWDMQRVDDAAIARDGLSQDMIQEVMAGVPTAHSAILLDTCYAGAFASEADRDLVDRAGAARLGRATGRAILSAASAVQTAIEGYQGHGVFTYSVLDALNGQADENRDGAISVQELGRYVAQSVPDIARRVWNASQTPVLSFTGKDFAISGHK